VEVAVMRGLARHPHQRWESVQAFTSAFEQAALSALPVLTQTVSRSQVVAAAVLESPSAPNRDDQATPPPRIAVAPAAMPAAAPEDELTDELSQKFFAEGEAQQAAHTVPQSVYVGRQPNHPSMRQQRPTGFEPTARVSSVRAYRQADEDQDLQISLDKLERVPRRRWPARLLLLAVLIGGAAGFWRSDLPYSAEARAWVEQRVTLPAFLTR
jgi:hypothetical protein